MLHFERSGDRIPQGQGNVKGICLKFKEKCFVIQNNEEKHFPP